jgi:acetyl esterase
MTPSDPAGQTYRNREPLDPQVRAIFDQSLAAREANPRVLDAAVMRSQEAITEAIFNIGAPAVAVERQIAIPGPGGEIPATVHAAAGDGLPVILYAHGGGYCVMSPRTHAKVTKELANGVGAIVVNIDYRLAPEHPFPAGIGDCIAAYRWLREHASELGGDPSRVALGGDSAGGGIVAAAALRRVAAGETPAAVLINCGWLDLRMDSKSCELFLDDDPLIDREVMEYWRACYAPEAARWGDPDVSPGLGEITNFPPAYIVAAGIDPLCAENEAFAERLRGASRDVTLARHDGMPHVFTYLPGISAGPPAVEAMSAWLREKLGAS